MKRRLASPLTWQGRAVAIGGGALLLLVGLVTGCSDSNEPGTGGGSGLTVYIAVESVTGPSYSASPEGIALITCDANLTATGQGGQLATWRDAVFRWYPPNDLTTPFDSAVISAQEVGQSWGDGTIIDGPAQHSAWRFYATIPFALRLEYRYRQEDGQVDTAAPAEFTCQPPIPVNPAPPSISGLTVQPASATIEPGDTLAVSFLVTAEAGLWQTIVAVTGTCDTTVFLPGHVVQSAAYNLGIPLGSNCTLGASLSVAVITIDAALQTAATTPVLRTVVDQTPPGLFVRWNDVLQAVSGDFFVGDSLKFQTWVLDNYRPKSVTWVVQPGGARDSLPQVPNSSQFLLAVPIRATWTAPLQLDFTATDVAGNTSGVVTIAGDSLRLYPDAPRPTAWRYVAGQTTDIRADSKRGVFYVLVMGIQRQLVTLGLTDAALVRTLDLPAVASSFDFTPSGDSLLLVYPLSNALGVVDLTAPVPQLSLQRLGTPDSSQGQTPEEVRTTVNGKAFIRLIGPALAQNQLLELDLASGVETVRLDAGNAGVVRNPLERSPGHGFLITGDGSGMAQVYDAATNQFGPLSALPAQALLGSVLSISADGQVLAFGREILGPNLQSVRSAHSVIGTAQTGSFVSPDGQSLYYVALSGLIRARVSDGAVIERSRLPINIPRTRISEDGQWAVYNGQSDFVSGTVGVIDLR